MRFLIFATLLVIHSIGAQDAQSFKNEMQKNIWSTSSSDSGSSEENYRADKKQLFPTQGITLNCDYALMRHYWGEMYTCVVRNLVSLVPSYVYNVTGQHMTGKTVKDVECIYVLGQRTPYLPYNITTPFGGNVKALRVEGSGLRYVNRTFAYDGALEYLHLENNIIEDVPKWAFRNLTELRWFSLRGNRIRYIESGLLVGMKKLWGFSASDNRIEVLPSNLFYDNPVLREIYFYNNRIRMVGARLVNWAKELKVAAFHGNGCTDISIYEGGDIRTQLTREFQTKCSIDCRHMEIAQQKFMKEVERENQAYEMCGRNWQ